MSAKGHENASVFRTLVKLQTAMLLMAMLVIYLFDARSLGKILALAVLFTVFSIVAFVHLQRRYPAAPARSTSSSSRMRGPIQFKMDSSSRNQPAS